MPYTMADFPIETEQPRIEVTLPIGRYVLELVVVDDARQVSAPDTVVITVKPAVIEVGVRSTVGVDTLVN